MKSEWDFRPKEIIEICVDGCLYHDCPFSHCPHPPLLPTPIMLSLTYPALSIFLSLIFQDLTWASSFTSTGQTLVLNDIPYYVPATPFATLPFLYPLQSAAFTGNLAPVTVVRLSASNASLEQAISGFGADDVWNEGFVEGNAGCCTFVQIVGFHSHISKYQFVERVEL